MSRTSRRFMLLDTLRGHRRPVTATRRAALVKQWQAEQKIKLPERS